MGKSKNSNLSNEEVIEKNNKVVDLNYNSDDEKNLLTSKTNLTQAQRKVFDSYNAALKEAKKNPEIKLEELFRDQLKFNNKNIIKKGFKALQNVFEDKVISDSNFSNILNNVPTGKKITGIMFGKCSRKNSTYQNHCDFNALIEALEKEQTIAENLAKLRCKLTNAHLRIFKAYNETIDELKIDPKIAFSKLETNFSNKLDGDKYKEVFINCFRGLYATFGNKKISEENAEKISKKINCNGKFLSTLYASFTLNFGYSSWWNKDAFNKVLRLIERDIHREQQETKETTKQENCESNSSYFKPSSRKNSSYYMNPFD
jgi:hypothetical protein